MHSSFQKLAQVPKLASVDHIVGGQPRPPRLIDTKTHVLECVHRIRISGDRDFDSLGLSHVRMDVVEIEAIAMTPRTCSYAAVPI